MAKSRTVAHRAKLEPKLEPVFFHKPKDAIWPEPFLLRLQQRAEAETNHAAFGLPPAKRVKHSNLEAIPILNYELTQNSPAHAANGLDISLTNCGDLIRFQLVDAEDLIETNSAESGDTDQMLIGTFPATSDAPAIDYAIAVDEIPEPFASVLRLKETQKFDWSNPEVEDTMWLQLDIHLTGSQDNILTNFVFSIHWNVTETLVTSTLPPALRDIRRKLLAAAFPAVFGGLDFEGSKACSPQSFYQAAHVPPDSASVPDRPALQELDTQLYPFQRRAIEWMLKREHADTSTSGKPTSETVAFLQQNDINQHICYISPLYGKISRDSNVFHSQHRDLSGGILAEEMGLGKTVEILGLVVSHRRPDPSIMSGIMGGVDRNTELGGDTRRDGETGATLIVAPAALAEQWASEINKHAPTLRVMSYVGINRARKSGDDEHKMMTKMKHADIVITTYNVLSSELDFAVDEPDRARRAPRKYARPKSPLVMLHWWRVCLDEAQMIESGVTKAATVARIIPRVHAWGVTGTPVKDSVNDLRGLLIFLGYEPFASNAQAWTTLTQTSRGFRHLFNDITIRHTKRLVRNELAIPAQKRYVITMPFAAVEEQHYRTLFEELAHSCGLDTSGAPLSDDWDPNDPAILEVMRIGLDRLRQTALHPEVGVRNRRELRVGQRQGPMRTMEEVLDAMIQNTRVTMRQNQRLVLSKRLTRGQLLENSPRVKEALDIWQAVLAASREIVADCRKHLDSELAKAKGKINMDGAVIDMESDEEAVAASRNQVVDAKRQLQLALELEHRAIFFCANAYFQIKTNEEFTAPDSEEFKELEELETEAYERAKQVRNEILQESQRRAKVLLDAITDAAADQTFATIPEAICSSESGIESRRSVEELQVLTDILNTQAEKIDEWREHVVQLLMKSLVDEDEEGLELTGEEYEESTKLQDELMVYVQILRTTIADREELLSGQKNELTEHELKMAVRFAKAGEGAFPERMLELADERRALKSSSAVGTLRGNVSALRGLTVKLRQDIEEGSTRARAELAVASNQLKATQAQLSQQQKVCTAMLQEIEKFTQAMNARMEYYRQLQNISDDVALYEGPKDDSTMAKMLQEEQAALSTFEKVEARYRYLLHLKEDSAPLEGRWHCVICQTDFTQGVLTVCGHHFCKQCISYWLKAHHNCPVCKRPLKASNLHDVVLKNKDMKVLPEATTSDAPESPKHKRNTTTQRSIFAEFDSTRLGEIQAIELDGPSYTTKVDNLIRHLLWLRDADPGAKTIIFSQYHDFLNIISLALSRYHIGYSSFDKPQGITKFKQDPAVECFLLHARAHSSGLNLVNASHVILCEPLVNTAIELQAIARVHRIGQQQETTVWLYIVEDTVEESIYHLSVKRRMAHMNRQDRHVNGKKAKTVMPKIEDGVDDEVLEAADMEEMEQASLSKLMSRKRALGETVAKDDLWECLFGHVARQKVDGEERMRNNPVVRAHLASEAADARAQDGGSGCMVLDHGL